MKKMALFSALTALLFVLAAASHDDGESKLSAYGYVVRQGDVALVADMDMARYRGDEAYIPLRIWLGNRGRGTVEVNRESFSLRDPKGTEHPLPAPAAVREQYGPSFISSDYGYYQRGRDYGDMLYLHCSLLSRVAYFPNPGGPPHILYDNVELPPRTYFRTLLYFPNPEGRAAGEYTLICRGAEGEAPLEVSFSIPWE